MDESQAAGIKIARRNISNLRFADDTTLMAESEEKLNSFHLLDEGERGQWKSCLKPTFKKTKIIASSPLTSRQTDSEKMETGADFIFSGSKITVDGNSSHEIKIH